MTSPNQHHTQLSLWRGEIGNRPQATLKIVHVATDDRGDYCDDHQYNWIMQIAREICARRGVTLAHIRGRSTRQDITATRWEVMYVLRAQRREGGRARLSYPRIGQILSRTHQPVIYGCRKHAEINGLPRLDR